MKDRNQNIGIDTKISHKTIEIEIIENKEIHK